MEIFGTEEQIKGTLTGENFASGTSYLAMKTSSKIQKVTMNEKWLLAFSKDESAQLFNFDDKKTHSSSPGHADHSILSGQVDPTGRFLATTGTDGFLNIYSLKSEDKPVKFLNKIQICDKKIDSTYKLDVQWLPDGETILAAGKESLGFVQKSEEDDAEWSITHEESVSHSAPITQILAFSEEILLTHCAAEKSIKIWRFGEEGCDAIWQFKVAKELKQIKYDKDSKTLALLDSDLNIAVVQGDFTKTLEEIQEEEKAKMEKKIAEEFEDIDLANFEMPDDEEPVNSGKNEAILSEAKSKEVPEVEMSVDADKNQMAVEEISKKVEQVSMEPSV